MLSMTVDMLTYFERERFHHILFSKIIYVLKKNKFGSVAHCIQLIVLLISNGQANGYFKTIGHKF
jgi:hypothetical protein